MISLNQFAREGKAALCSQIPNERSQLGNEGLPVGAKATNGARKIAVSFVVHGAPRTKKTSNRVVPGRGRKAGRTLVLPSAAWAKWVKSATLSGAVPSKLNGNVSCCALFYRDRNSGDAVGYYQGLADALEQWGIVTDDKYITDWDGSRLLLDYNAPRVEVTVTWWAA